MQYDDISKAMQECNEVHRSCYELRDATHKLMYAIASLAETMGGSRGLPEIMMQCHDQLRQNEELMRNCEEACCRVQQFLEQQIYIVEHEPITQLE